ncbi:MAG: hypothetical protein Q8J78_06055, partial [Moraxellaceae bacterium]|nr:hypothetical protein [Moraxellaceae bacterium]
MKNSTFLVFLLLAFSGAQAREDSCDERIFAIVGEKLMLEEFSFTNDDGVVVDATCKLWPYRKNITIAAFGYIPP